MIPDLFVSPARRHVDPTRAFAMLSWLLGYLCFVFIEASGCSSLASSIHEILAAIWNILAKIESRTVITFRVKFVCWLLVAILLVSQVSPHFVVNLNYAKATIGFTVKLVTFTYTIKLRIKRRDFSAIENGEYRSSCNYRFYYNHRRMCWLTRLCWVIMDLDWISSVVWRDSRHCYH